jgi:hypothetical protein
MTTVANDTSSPTDRHPRPGRPLMLAAGLLLLAVLVGAVVWVLVTLALPGRMDFSYRADLPPATQLRIDTASAAFTLTPSPDSGIHISAHGSYTDIEPTIHTTTGGDTATITNTCAHPGLFRRCDLQVQLLLPTKLPVTADVGNGQLTARDLSGPLNLTTGNGIIQAVTTTGTLSLHTSNGTIRLTDSRSAHVTADTTNGAMNLAFAVPPVTLAAHSTNGAVDITVPGTNAYFITATTTNGSKHIDLPTDRSAPDSITATTTNGAIHINPTSP